MTMSMNDDDDRDNELEDDTLEDGDESDLSLEERARAEKVFELSHEYRRRIAMALDIIEDDLDAHHARDVEGFGDRMTASAMALGSMVGFLTSFFKEMETVMAPFRHGLEAGRRACGVDMEPEGSA